MSDVGLGVGHVGIAGEFRCVVKRADGSVKEDTGYQRNLILNQGLDFFGGEKGTDMMQLCQVGEGNATPVATQTALISYKAQVSGAASSMDYSYADDGSGFYKCNRVVKFTFSSLGNANISEVGLASNNAGTPYLCTRALLKDTLGDTTTITVLTGEVLEIYYKLWKVVSIADSSYAVTMSDGKGGSIAYTARTRLAKVGDLRWGDGIGKALNTDRYGLLTTESESTVITSIPGNAGGANTAATVSVPDYVNGTYKRVVTYNFGVSDANLNIRNLLSFMSNPAYVNNLIYFQIRYGATSGDTAIPKTDLQKLELPLEYSWGRYEGAL